LVVVQGLTVLRNNSIGAWSDQELLLELWNSGVVVGQESCEAVRLEPMVKMDLIEVRCHDLFAQLMVCLAKMIGGQFFVTS
jgi:hypothetical protein